MDRQEITEMRLVVLFSHSEGLLEQMTAGMDLINGIGVRYDVFFSIMQSQLSSVEMLKQIKEESVQGRNEQAQPIALRE